MAKSRGPSHKAYYTRAAKEMTAVKNRRRKLEKLAKLHPNNTQITEALKNVKYRRKTPNTSLTSTIIKEAKGFDAKVRSMPKNTADKVLNNTKYMFSLAARAHTVNGEYPWAKQ